MGFGRYLSGSGSINNNDDNYDDGDNDGSDDNGGERRSEPYASHNPQSVRARRRGSVILFCQSRSLQQ